MNASKYVMRFWLTVQPIRYANLLNHNTTNWSLKAIWIVKCKALTKQNYIDDIEMDEESVAEMILDENALASMPRYCMVMFQCC